MRRACVCVCVCVCVCACVCVCVCLCAPTVTRPVDPLRRGRAPAAAAGAAAAATPLPRRTAGQRRARRATRDAPEHLALVQPRQAWGALRPGHDDHPVRHWLTALQAAAVGRVAAPVVELALRAWRVRAAGRQARGVRARSGHSARTAQRDRRCRRARPATTAEAACPVCCCCCPCARVDALQSAASTRRRAAARNRATRHTPVSGALPLARATSWTWAAAWLLLLLLLLLLHVLHRRRCSPGCALHAPPPHTRAVAVRGDAFVSLCACCAVAPRAPATTARVWLPACAASMHRCAGNRWIAEQLLLRRQQR
jgi:hypothetical protein